jgi:hypothetical protein
MPWNFTVPLTVAPPGGDADVLPALTVCRPVSKRLTVKAVTEMRPVVFMGFPARKSASLLLVEILEFGFMPDAVRVRKQGKAFVMRK